MQRWGVIYWYYLYDVLNFFCKFKCPKTKSVDKKRKKYWISMLPGSTRVDESEAQAWPKRRGLSKSPREEGPGELLGVSESVHVKAHRSWDSQERGIVKKASLRGRTVKTWVLGGIEPRMVSGFGTAEWRRTTSLLTMCRSWAGP